MPSFLPRRWVLVAGVSSFGLFCRAIRALIRDFFAFSGELGSLVSSSLEANSFVVSSLASLALRVFASAPKNHALGH